MQILQLIALKGIGMEYCLIDCTNALAFGPYETFNKARERADALPAWEIIDGNGDIIDWSSELVQESARAKSWTHG